GAVRMRGAVSAPKSSGPSGEDQAAFEQLRVASQPRSQIEAGFFKLGLEQLTPESASMATFASPASSITTAGPNTLGKLSRYEARIERSFYEALEELQRLHFIRAHEFCKTKTIPKSVT